jgi:hypothetical protein
MKYFFTDKKGIRHGYDPTKGTTSGITGRAVLRKCGKVTYRWIDSDGWKYVAKIEKSKIYKDTYNVFIDNELIFKSDDVDEIFNTFLQW